MTATEDRIETAAQIVRAEAMRFISPEDRKKYHDASDDWMWFEACRAMIVCAIEDVIEAVKLDADVEFVGRSAIAQARFARQKLAARWADDILSLFAGYLPTSTPKTAAKVNGSSSLSALTAIIYDEATGETGKVGYEDSVVRKAVLEHVREIKKQWPWLASLPKRRSLSQAPIDANEACESDLRQQERDERWAEPTIRLAEILSPGLGNRFQIEWEKLRRRDRDEPRHNS